jgi:hypothetical protein
MDLHKLYSTNKDLEQQGVTFEIAGAEFTCKIIGENNKPFQEAWAKMMRPWSGMQDKIPPQVAQEIMVKCFINHSLVTWDKVEYKGKNLKFSKDNATTLFNELPNLFYTLLEMARNHANYQDDDKESTVKN